MTAATPAPLVDTHCHLVLLETEGLLEAALEGAAAAGVQVIVSVGLNLEDSHRNRVLAEAYDGVYFSAGWHPHESRPPDAASFSVSRMANWKTSEAMLNDYLVLTNQSPRR